MKMFILFILFSLILDVRSAVTGKRYVATIVEPHTTPQSKKDDAVSATVIGQSLSSPADTRQFGPLLDGVVIEPVMVSNNDIIMQSLGDENIAKPILIKDDNLIIKPNEEPVPEPVLINDTNLMIQPKEDVLIEPVLIKDDNLIVKNNTENGTALNETVISDTIKMTKDSVEIITPTTPVPMSTTTMKSISSPSASNPVHVSRELAKPCPDFDSRYEEGKFIVTLDDGKCEMVVSANTISQNKGSRWASGRYTPIYQLLSRKHKPQVTFRQTSIAPGGYNCKHRTRQTGTFFIVDTIIGRCQMVIGIPALPDLKYAMSNAKQPAWNRPMRHMPTWPRQSSAGQSSAGGDSDD